MRELYAFISVITLIFTGVVLALSVSANAEEWLANGAAIKAQEVQEAEEITISDLKTIAVQCR